MRTAHAVSPLSVQQVSLSMMTFVIVYFLVFGTGVYYMLKLMKAGPALPDVKHDDTPDTRPTTPRAARCRPSTSRSRPSGTLSAYEKTMDVTVIWAAIIALLHVRRARRFRPRHRHRLPVLPGREGTRPDDEHGRTLWDGNETWLVLGGAGLFAVFPVVYSTVLSALYLPLIFMLVCLIFRGVSFEIRAKARRTKQLWDLAFIGGSAGATLFQGSRSARSCRAST